MRALILVLLVLGTLVVPAGALAAPSPSASCENVEGTFLGQAVPTATGFDVYAIAVTGPLAGHPLGTQLVWTTVDKATAGGTIHFSGTHALADSAFGPFTTADSGVIAPNGRVHNRLTIVDGASGTVNVHGHADLATGVIDVSYHGRVCEA